MASRHIPNALFTPIEDRTEIEGMFGTLFAYINQLVAIPVHDQELCRQYFKPFAVKKGTLLASAGTIHTHHNFIVSGYVRNYHLDEKGREITTDLLSGPGFFTSYHSFIQQTISQENLHCLTDCSILRINRTDNELVTRGGQRSQQYVEKILQHHLEASRQHIIDLNTLTAKERYLKLTQNHPQLLQHVSVNYIASYLGINAGSLSRIRQELAG